MHRIPVTLATTSTLILLAIAPATGCIVISAKAPKVCHRPHPPAAKPAHAVRYTPYAHALERVLGQEGTVERELRRRDWHELSDEISDWQRYTRRLAGLADTTHAPAQMRAHCTALEDLIQRMREGTRQRDAEFVAAALDETAPVLAALAAEFPLTEPLDTERAAHGAA
jgi:hypothetical protein